MSEPWGVSDLLPLVREAYEKERLHHEWNLEQQAVREALFHIAGELNPTKRYHPEAVLGVGGSGIAVKLRDELLSESPKALKFPRPVPGRVAVIADMLEKEIEYLSSLRHPSIVRILDYGVLADVPGYEKLPYYVMDFVPGAPSKEYIRDPNTTSKDFRRLARQSAEVLAYLHGPPVQFAHLDLKPDNILVAADGSPVMIDLGTCKRFSEDGSATVVACTKSFAHPELLRRLSEDPSDVNRTRGELPRRDIRAKWDLWSFGLTLLDWMGIDFNTGAAKPEMLYGRMPSYDRKYFMLLAARLLVDSPRTWLLDRVGLSEMFLQELPVGSAQEVAELIGRLDGVSNPLESVPELAEHRFSTLQAGPATHVPYTSALKAAMNHPSIRRLNAITQLGIVSQVYPGAKHTRREHSLGTFANTGRVIRRLYDDPLSPLFKQIITAADCHSLLGAALFHDIGQFPLAHDLEDIDGKVFDHADLTVSMLRGKFEKKRKGSRLIRFKSLDETLALWNTTADRVAAILSARAENSTASAKDKLLRSIISGPIDADKLDYLARDARHTDVPYPTGVDIDRLYRCLTTVVIPRVSAQALNVPALGIHAKGRVAAEFLTIARYAMFSQVYWHHTVRAGKAMLFRAVESLLASLRSDEDIARFTADFVSMVVDLPQPFYRDQGELTDPTPTLFGRSAPQGPVSHSVADLQGTDLTPTDAAVIGWLRDRLDEANRPEARLLSDLLSRRLYKRLWVVSRDMDESRWEDIVRLWDSLDRYKRHKVGADFEGAVSARIEGGKMADVTEMKAEDARDRIKEYQKAEIPWLLVDIPGSRTGSEVPLHYVLEGQRRHLRKDDRVVGDLKESRVWQDFAKDLRRAAGKIRVFCEPTLVDAVEASFTWERGVQDLLDVLENLNP